LDKKTLVPKRKNCYFKKYHKNNKIKESKKTDLRHRKIATRRFVFSDSAECCVERKQNKTKEINHDSQRRFDQTDLATDVRHGARIR
jgi:hypothetical protein